MDKSSKKEVQNNKEVSSNKEVKCTHPSRYKEYIYGHSTGEYICNTCGETLSNGEWS